MENDYECDNDNGLGYVKVKCLSTAYYRDRIRLQGWIIKFYDIDRDQGFHRAGPDKGKRKPQLPKWARVVDIDTEETVEDKPSPEEIALSQIAAKGNPAQQKAAQKVKDDQAALDLEKEEFEKEKKAFEESKKTPAKSEAQAPTSKKKKPSKKK